MVGPAVRTHGPGRVSYECDSSGHTTVRAATVVLAGDESHADYGRLANASEAATEFAENDDDEIITF